MYPRGVPTDQMHATHRRFAPIAVPLLALALNGGIADTATAQTLQAEATVSLPSQKRGKESFEAPLTPGDATVAGVARNLKRGDAVSVNLVFDYTTSADIALDEGDYERARQLASAAADCWRDAGDPGYMLFFVELGNAFFAQGRLDEAEAAFARCVGAIEMHWQRDYLCAMLVGLAATAGERGQATRSAVLLGAADALLDSIGGSWDGFGDFVRRLRERPDAYGLVTANGGYLSKHAAGVYSSRTFAGAWRRTERAPLQRSIDAMASPEVADSPTGRGRIETYSVAFSAGEPRLGIVIGRLEHDGRRFLANTPDGDTATLAALVSEEALGRRGDVRQVGDRNIFELA